MAKYYFTNKAVDDLSSIWTYTVEIWSENQADAYFQLLLSSCHELAINPTLGRNYEMLGKDILGYKSGEHLILYLRLSQNEIEVIRILLGMIDLKSEF
ncbi:type II toxin-antitoxin system RelE/ParE family toxin [Aquirufa aurantiipilula]